MQRSDKKKILNRSELMSKQSKTVLLSVPIEQHKKVEKIVKKRGLKNVQAYLLILLDKELKDN